jgi:murein DD-endopeptidase MepM/ murein hydrolase activator NlpD
MAMRWAATALLGSALWCSSSSCNGDENQKKWTVKRVDLRQKSRLARSIPEPTLTRSWSATAVAEVQELETPYVFGWPLADLNITSPYGHRHHPVVKRILFHRGVDLSAPRGTPVLSAAPGIVEFSGTLPLTGETVIVAHRGGFQTLYAHLAECLVWPGMVVDKGAPVGLIGSTGRSTGPHLHFQMNRTTHSVDPTEYLGRAIDFTDTDNETASTGPVATAHE